ncbi:hypothetical protein SRIMM317S_04274 [Streptomyces rimosus subsp. rimosus]
MHDVRETPHRWRSAFALVLLAPLVGVHFLGNTPMSDLGALFLYLPLYGCAALLIREIARRTGRGWPTMLLLAAAYGLFEEGPVDQMLWNPHYGTADFGPWLPRAPTCHCWAPACPCSRTSSRCT